MNANNPFWPKHAFVFKIGGPSVAPQIAAAPIPAPTPPVSSTNAEVAQAEHDFAKQGLLKKSVKKTILAGDTGGYSVGAPGAGLPTPKIGGAKPF